MKRPRAAVDSLGVEEKGLCDMGFTDEDEVGEEEPWSGGAPAAGEKKRRLGLEQVRALERSFESENKLDPERKARLARELGLQPRQVAVWFQNRRARWKTKRLERDFAALRAAQDALLADIDALSRHNQSLAAEADGLRARLATAAAAPLPESSATPPPTSASDTSAVASESPPLDLGGVTTQEGLVFYDVQQYMKLEPEEEPCSSFFPEEEAPAPTLSWCCLEEWI